MAPVTIKRPHLELALTVDPTEVSRARRAVSRALEDLGHPDLVEDAQQIVSELVTNALRETTEKLSHLTREYLAACRVKFLVHENDGHPTVEVWDMFPDEIPMPQQADLDMESGRGLFIVRSLAKEWGYVHRFDAERVWKSVWAVLT
ncbi:ATP-binding protein [Spirillospora albida]|uniref:ATP-binding protein n=1 Tax=Spirillospora albida TaxID=58123 RepID=UPI00068C99F8|nr:ATP-binding protein [Spirillospora albida]